MSRHRRERNASISSHGTRKNDQGGLRISRRGRQVYYLSAEGDSPHDRLWGTREITDAPVDLNGIRLQTQIHETGSTSVVWKTLRVHADRITGIGSGAENPLLTDINQKRDELPSRFLFDFTKLPRIPTNFYRWMDTRPWTESAQGWKFFRRAQTPGCPLAFRLCNPSEVILISKHNCPRSDLDSQQRARDLASSCRQISQIPRYSDQCHLFIERRRQL